MLHERDFTIIDNAAIRDRRLSFKARGLHHLLLSLPAGWRIEAKRLATQFSEHDGRDAVRAGLAELEAHRYVATVRQQDSAGRFQTITYVYETPALNPYPQGMGVRRKRERRGVNAQVTPKTDNPASVGGSDANAQVTPKTVLPASVLPASVLPASDNPASQEVPREEELPLTPAGAKSAAADSLVGRRRLPTPTPNQDALVDQRIPVPVGRSRQQGLNPRALGTNPRAKAQKVAEATQRDQVLAADRSFGERTARIELNLTDDELERRLRDEAKREPNRGWDDERIATVVAGFRSACPAEQSEEPEVIGLNDGLAEDHPLAAKVADIARRARSGWGSAP